MKHYVQWRSHNTHALADQIAESMTHWKHRFELGSAVLLCDDPKTALKLVEKNWRKLTMQVQKERQKQVAADDILQTTHTISRMQRVRLSNKSPEADPQAQFYILSPQELTALPPNCFTLYVLEQTSSLSPFFEKLAPGGLVVTYHKPTGALSRLLAKSVLEEAVQTEEALLSKWLKTQSIDITLLEDDLEKTNQALDTLLSSPRLQTEFLLKTKLLLHTVELAQPLRLSEQQEQLLQALRQLEHYVKVLSTSWVNESVQDSSEDAFLLRDGATGKYALSDLLETLDAQHKAGRKHLAQAIEARIGIVHAQNPHASR